MPVVRSSALLLLVAALVPPAAAEGPGLSVTAGFAPSGAVAAGDPVVLTLSRPVPASEGRIAVLVGLTDWSDFFDARGATLAFTPGAVSLPAGATELTAYLVTPEGEWRELARFPLTVRPRGVENVKPVLDLLLKAQVAEGHRPEEDAPPRGTFQDLGLQASLETEHAREGFASKARVKLVGASYRNEALRFGALGEQAPRVDLAGYAVELTRGQGQLRLGDLVWGGHRHLMQNFGGRGSAARLALGAGSEVGAVALSGSKLVGWGNPFGITESAHRLVAGTLGVELVPSRPGALRLEASALDGSVLPIASYNQGSIRDAAESRGIGLRVAGSDSSGRLRAEGSLARSSFRNAPDAELEAGLETVEVQEETRSARHARLEVDALRDVMVGGTRPLTLTFGTEHERIDPLYRSVGVAARGDVERNALSAWLLLGEASLQATHARSRDNLDRIASILTTRTRQSGFAVSVPLGSFASETGAPWLPVVSYALDRVRQAGDGVPADSDFNPSHVPDQVSLGHTGGLAWQGERVSLAYSFSRSSQDNRQPGREHADFAHTTHGLALGVVQTDRLDLALDVTLERSENVERDEIDRLRRVGLTLAWRAPRGFGLTALFGTSWSDDEAETRDGRSLEADLQASWRVSFRAGRKAPAANLFLRWATQRARARDVLLELEEDRQGWQLTTGVTLSAF